MAVTLEGFNTSTYVVQKGRGGGVETTSRACMTSRELIPDKTSGVWITFPDGSRFRRATAHNAYSSSIVLGSPQHTEATVTSPAIWQGNKARIDTSLGGYQPDDLYRFAQFDALKSIGIANLRNPPGGPTQNNRNKAVTEALNNLADQKANIGENLATFLQTVRLIKDPLSLLTRGLRSVHANKSFRPFLRQSARDLRRKGPLTAAAEEYLKYVYGWKPLMQDIYGIIELSKQGSSRPLLLHAKSSTLTQQGVDYTYDNYSHACKTRLVVNATDRTNCKLWYRIDPDHATLRALNQLGLVNPLALAWDLVPFSFVLDWVLPIGSTLNALTAPAGLRFVDGSLSRRVTASGPYLHWSYLFEGNFPTYSVGAHAQATGTFTYNGYTRERLLSSPLPGFYVDYDPFRGDRPLKALALTVIGLKSLR